MEYGRQAVIHFPFRPGSPIDIWKNGGRSGTPLDVPVTPGSSLFVQNFDTDIRKTPGKSYTGSRHHSDDHHSGLEEKSGLLLIASLPGRIQSKCLLGWFPITPDCSPERRIQLLYARFVTKF